MAAGGAPGAQHAALLTRGGEVYTWGSGLGGKLGHGTNTGAPAPQQVGWAEAQLLMAACAHSGACSSRLVAWQSRAASLQLDARCFMLGARICSKPAAPLRSTPDFCQVVRLFGKGTASVACGHTYTAAVLRDGSLHTWGTGLAGQLGLGDGAAPSQPLPVRVPLLGRAGPGSCIRVEHIACGPYHLAAASREGVLYTWGDGMFGRLGHGSHDGAASPRAVDALRGSWVLGVACGWWHTAAVAVAREDLGRRRSASRAEEGSGSEGERSASASFSAGASGSALSSSTGGRLLPLGAPPPGARGFNVAGSLSLGGGGGVVVGGGGGGAGRGGGIGGALFTWGGDFRWHLHGARDHHQGCLGHGDLEGRLLPTPVLGEDDVRQVRPGAGHGRCDGGSRRRGPGIAGARHLALLVLHSKLVPPPASRTFTLHAAHSPRLPVAAASQCTSMASARCCRWAPPARPAGARARRCGSAP